jgi:hypothetical protein
MRYFNKIKNPKIELPNSVHRDLKYIRSLLYSLSFDIEKTFFYHDIHTAWSETIGSAIYFFQKHGKEPLRVKLLESLFYISQIRHVPGSIRPHNHSLDELASIRNQISLEPVENEIDKLIAERSEATVARFKELAISILREICDEI